MPLDLTTAAFAFIWIFGIVSFISLFFVTAPYGRHQREGWGPTLPARWGWLIMESPPVFAFAAFYALGPDTTSPVALFLLGLWMLHYIHRDLIWPFRMKGGDRPMPASVAGMAVVFNLANAWINATALSDGRFADASLTEPRLLLGAAIFLLGEGINHHADTTLLNLRKPGETGYKIPYGGMYRFISAPNYFGEILAWTGFAIAAGTPAAVTFAVFTFFNLGPRARTHHQWYLATFPDYPKDRKALIPFLW